MESNPAAPDNFTAAWTKMNLELIHILSSNIREAVLEPFSSTPSTNTIGSTNTGPDCIGFNSTPPDLSATGWLPFCIQEFR
ncbi:unnamed protein product [Protopolystoma xenopodis]|uniref:Uncharacterized protein n=1 Tax=Protopolystoma xenopodis TaxID=117903 RepID=A0A3S5C919_9PLAT|nr:unnamed protein product [Protopolystoma xenopodis]